MFHSEAHTVLGIVPGASNGEIKTAFRKLAHQYHPDKPGGDEAKFKQAAEAYRTLSQREQSAPRNAYGHAGTPARRAEVYREGPGTARMKRAYVASPQPVTTEFHVRPRPRFSFFFRFQSILNTHANVSREK